MTSQLLIFFLIALFSVRNPAQADQPVNSSTHNLSVVEKTELVTEWVREADNYHKWSHEARLGFALAAYENASDNQNIRLQAMYCLAKLYTAEGSFNKALAFFDTLHNYAIDYSEIN